MIMRKLFNTLFVIIAAMVTFAGCAKEEVNAPANETKTVQFIAESIETKTHFGTPENGSYPTLWDNGDKVKVLLNLDAPSGVKKLEATAEIAEISSDSKSATFNAEMNADYVTDSYTFYAVAPSTAYNAKSSSEGRFTVQIPSEQTPQASSVDKAAQVIYAVSETTTSMPSSVSMHFRHMTAYGKFSLTNLSDKVSSISQVKIVAPEGICLSGKWNYMIADGSIVAHGDNTSNFVTIKTTSTENIWFACAPVDASGKDVKFIVTTDQGDLEKTVSFPKAFEPGKIATFAVNMSGIEPPVQEETTQYYQKVTSDLDDWSGKYLLVYETGNKVLSSISTTSTKYGVGTEVTITDGKIQATADVMSYQIEITKPSSVDEYLMNFGGQYLTWTSGNSLNVATSVSDNTTWTIAVSDGNATITNKKDKTRVIKWNSSSPRFACYTSGQTAVQLYKLIEDGNEGGETPDVPTAPILTVTPAIIEIGCAGGNEELSYTVTNALDGVSVAVSATAEWIAIDDSTEGKVIISVAENTLTEVREATISLSYEGAETMTVVVKQKGAVVVDPSFESGLYWIIADGAGVLMKPLAGNYGYPEAVPVQKNNEEYVNYAVNAFSFEVVTGTQYYKIKDSNGKYLYMNTKNDGSWYTSFNVGAYSDGERYHWAIAKGDNSEYVISNLASNYQIAYSSTHKSWGVYEDGSQSDYSYPVLAKADNPLPVELVSIVVSDQTKSYSIDDEFIFDGTVTATYTDGTTKTVEPTSVTKPDMTSAGDKEIKVEYVEGVIVKEFTYTISVVSSGESQPVIETKTLSFADKAQRTIYTTSKQVWEQNGIVFTNDKGSSTSNVGDYAKPARFYKSSKITVAVADEYKITEIKFACNNSSYATALKTSITSGGTVTVSDKDVTVVLTTPASSFVANLTGGQVRMDSVTVTYQN